MADGLHSKRLALDTNILLDLAAGYEFALRFRAEFQARNYALLFTSDAGILEADQIALALAFGDAGLPIAHPVHPAKLTRALR